MKKVVFALFIATTLIHISVAKAAPGDNENQRNTRRANISASERSTVNNSKLCDLALKNDLVNLKISFKKQSYNNEQTDMKCKYGNSLLMIAVKAGNYQTAKFLIDQGADVNQKNYANQTALHISARSTKSNANDILDLLLSAKGINVNIQDTEGYTPLMRAIDFENINAISKLLNAGSNVNIKNNYGYSAIDLANKNLKDKKGDEDINISKTIVGLLQHGRR